MKIIRDLWQEAIARPTVVTFGVFDGVHLGHQRILRTVVARAQALEATPTVITFDPHPRHVLRPETAPPLLQTLEQRLEAFAELGIEQVVIMRFTREVAAVSAEEFLLTYVFGRLDARELYLGKGAAFGRDRQGRIELAQEIAARLGRRAVEIEEVTLRGHRVRATVIRRLLRAGRVNLARRLLGRPYEIRGRIVSGSGRGREILVPTANLNAENPILPATGVYVTLVRFADRWYPGVTNIGHRPTFGGDPHVSIETHLLDWEGEVLGASAALRFLRRLRSEQRFESADALRIQIERDIARARRYFAHPRVRALLGETPERIDAPSGGWYS
ncbi:MAG: riboflavin biosynthesis protein RibF [Blastocatellia bacterium]|nr:riboflavin biosynthesis protein RibF [Blastocatellia bacterium]MCS7157075.1 riboflavin biosynthesis protein RibF [Blastocatellia bacterium]MCX7752276.1 riboflavin biosynthesis protein RibF [Blastocatellia bacterium]MDW8167768.1 riboflavin biosynthesis protein RibF [Acidobacteriota bacterium]MDW8256589.1 riboflavin biosynthesis protein RibF [Acidobacteriota bacterium]